MFNGNAVVKQLTTTTTKADQVFLSLDEFCH